MRTTLRTAAAVLGLGLALTACGTDPVPNNQGEGGKAPATTATETPAAIPAEDIPTTHTGVGGFNADQVEAAQRAAEMVIARANDPNLVLDLVEQSTEDRIAALGPIITSTAADQIRAASDAHVDHFFAFDVYATFDGEEATSYTGVGASETALPRPGINEATGNLVLEMPSTGSIATKYPAGSRDGVAYPAGTDGAAYDLVYTLEMADTGSGWVLVAIVSVSVNGAVDGWVAP